MKRLISTPSLATIALTLGAVAAASSAQAHSDVSFYVGVQVPGMYVQSAPVYVQPAPLNVQPWQVYRPVPVRYERYDEGRRHEGPHWQGRRTYGDHERVGFANVYEPGGPRNLWQSSQPYGPNGDLDRDGIPNRFDRAPNNPYRR